MNVLLCTLGMSWAAIAEVVGFLRPDILDLYREHPAVDALRRRREMAGLQPPHEVWVVTTGGKETADSIHSLAEWWQLLGAPLPLRVWVALATTDLGTEDECREMRELTLRVALLASERSRTGQLVVSLAGGRKAMSADMQRAAGIFGTTALLHVVGKEPLPQSLRCPAPELLASALDASLADALTPVIVGQTHRSDVLDVARDDVGIITPEAFPVPAAPLLGTRTGIARWSMLTDTQSLAEELLVRERQSSRIMGNFFESLGSTEMHETWRSFYRLPPALIDEFRHTKCSSKHMQFLQCLPRAELHCHLGGILDLPALQRVGTEVWSALTATEREATYELTQELFAAVREGREWEWEWPRTLQRKGARNRSAACARLLAHLSAKELEYRLFSPTLPRIGLAKTHHGFPAYERPGELGGSALLNHEAAIAPYAAEVKRAAEEQGLRYLEVRGSPDKYLNGRGQEFVRAFSSALKGNDDCIIRFIWTLERRWQKPEIAAAVNSAVEAARELEHFIVGLDLAGDELQDTGLHDLAAALTSAFESYIPITIHAGEQASADAIWQTAYLLHADRVGHGLTLVDRPELANKMRERRIAVEACPTSDREVVGFRDPAIDATSHLAEHPICQLLEWRVPIAMCTDNPAISRTNSVSELLTASRMADGLSLWRVMSIIRQSFVHAFLPANDREQLLQRADAEAFRVASGFHSFCR